MTDPTPAGVARPQTLYAIEGEPREQFTLLALRDRIRGGVLQREDQISVAGTDLWKPAWQYPPLERYFALATAATAGRTPASAAPAGSMIGRLVSGLLYPFTNVASIVFIFATGFVAPIKLVAALLSLLGMVYALAIIRRTAEGELRAPALSAAGGAGDWILNLLRVIAITFISAWPIIAVVFLFFFGFRSMALIPIAVLVMLLYYPACLATVAMWKSIGMALSVKRIFAFIGNIGADYYLAVAGAIVAMIVVAVLNLGAALVVPRLLATAINGTLSVWAIFYASHLLGWAVYRHRDAVEVA